MELKIGRTDGSESASVWVGRPSMGKTLPHDATVRVYVTVLNSVVREIESRESAKRKQRLRWRRWRADAMYYLAIDEHRLLAEHPTNGELRELIATVRHRGPAVDVVLQHRRQIGNKGQPPRELPTLRSPKPQVAQFRGRPVG
ncbi:hypothetical protein ACH4VR_36155 [Streptomyces sp. NPDC020883]|uniref:hypothetical protein n=1 Tax=Streptomyces sp. NPDC020883 TaxID=3365099 RepID=UPI0037912FA8